MPGAGLRARGRGVFALQGERTVRLRLAPTGPRPGVPARSYPTHSLHYLPEESLAAMPARPRPIRAWNLPATAPPPTGQAAALEAALDRELVRQLGAVPLVLPLLEQLDNSRRALIANTLNGRFDVQKVRALAAEQSTILQQLIEANAELEAKVYSILTSEQQRKVDELRSQTMATMKTRFPEW